MREIVFPEETGKISFYRVFCIQISLHAYIYYSIMQKYTLNMQFSFVCAKLRNVYVYCTRECYVRLFNVEFMEKFTNKIVQSIPKNRVCLQRVKHFFEPTIWLYVNITTHKDKCKKINRCFLKRALKDRGRKNCSQSVRIQFEKAILMQTQSLEYVQCIYWPVNFNLAQLFCSNFFLCPWAVLLIWKNIIETIFVQLKIKNQPLTCCSHIFISKANKVILYKLLGNIK